MDPGLVDAHAADVRSGGVKAVLVILGVATALGLVWWLDRTVKAQRITRLEALKVIVPPRPVVRRSRILRFEEHIAADRDRTEQAS